MSKKTREIECLYRFQQLTGAIEDMLDFLYQEQLLSKDDVKKILSSADFAKDLQVKLMELSAQGRLQLIEYEWTILPVERIKILIISDKTTKEFTYGG